MLCKEIRKTTIPYLTNHNLRILKELLVKKIQQLTLPISSYAQRGNQLIIINVSEYVFAL